jgi:hypothetical protein
MRDLTGNCAGYASKDKDHTTAPYEDAVTKSLLRDECIIAPSLRRQPVLGHCLTSFSESQ